VGTKERKEEIFTQGEERITQSRKRVFEVDFEGKAYEGGSYKHRALEKGEQNGGNEGIRGG